MRIAKKCVYFLPEALFYCSVLCGLAGCLTKQWKIGAIGGLVIIALLIYELCQYGLHGRIGPVRIDTPDGSNQPYHPLVVYFKDGWNGYRYWMAYTPFPIGAAPYQDRWEYPCIAVSQDGVRWNAIGENLPLDDLTEQQILNRDYFSDTHLVYNDKLDRLECFYRLSTEEKGKEEKYIHLFMRYTTDGLHWSQRNRMSYVGAVQNEFPAISPAVEIIDGVYHMWYVQKPGIENKNMKVYHASSSDGLNWSHEQICRLEGLEIDPWHIDCKFYNNQYYLLTYDFSHRLILWQSQNGVDFDYYRTVLKPCHICGSFYRMSLYRSCILQDTDGFKIYFSCGNERKLGIGLMTGPNLDSLKVVSASKDVKISDFWLDLVQKYTCHIQSYASKLRRLRRK